MRILFLFHIYFLLITKAIDIFSINVFIIANTIEYFDKNA